MSTVEPLPDDTEPVEEEEDNGPITSDKVPLRNGHAKRFRNRRK